MIRKCLTAAVAIAAGAAFVPATASAWAPASTASIHPGVQLFTNGAQCTANFIYSDGSSTYIGQAAHCSGTGSSTDTNGCTSASLPVGTPVDITGASHPGTPVYNSWLTMQARGETDPDTCAYNDLALVRVDPPTSPTSTRRCRASAGRPESARPAAPAPPCTRTATPSCAAA